MKNCRRSSHLLAGSPLFLSPLSLHSFHGSFLSENWKRPQPSNTPLALTAIMTIIINNLRSGVAVEGADSLAFHSRVFIWNITTTTTIMTFPSDVIGLQLCLPSPGLCLQTPALQLPSTFISNSHTHTHTSPVFSAQSPEKKEKRNCVTSKIRFYLSKPRVYEHLDTWRLLKGCCEAAESNFPNFKLGRSLRPNIDTLIHT